MIRLLFALILLLPAAAAATPWDSPLNQRPASAISVYYSPSCGCCKGWIRHLQRHHFKVEAIPSEDMAAVKKRLGVPESLGSCHTAVIGGYLIEGHVPAADILALIQRGDRRIRGISVPQMPTGTPGMEAGDRRDPFDVVAFDQHGNPSLFHRYPHY